MTHITFERLQDYLHGALPPQEDALVYAHLEQCAQCRAEHEAERTIGDSIRTYAAATEREFPPTLKAAIWSEIRAARPSVWTRLAASFRPAIALPVAAVLAAGIYFGVTNLSGNGPTIDAAYYLQDHADMTGTTPFSDRNVTPADMETAAVHAIDVRPVAVQEAATYTADAAHR